MINGKIIFLGYKNNQTKIVKFIRSQKINVKCLGQKELTEKDFDKNIILIISFGYKSIIKNKILQKYNKIDFINLHMSYLPYNRGAYPNFWSFYKNSPKGVSIHLINKEIDKGKIIFRKKIHFKNIEKQTFKTTYNYLFKNLENLFIKNFSKIILKRYKIIKVRTKGSFHRKKDLPDTLLSWNTNIYKYLKKY